MLRGPQEPPMPSKPKKSTFTPGQMRIEGLDIVPLRVTRSRNGGWMLVTKVTVAADTADGRRFGTRTATVRIPVEAVGGGPVNGRAKGRSAR
jgi:hypothetical protein